MSSFDSQRQSESSLKRRWPQNFNHPNSHNKTPTLQLTPALPSCCTGFDQDLVAPPVTVVLEGRSICQRISLYQHGSYQSLAMALKHMFMDIISSDQNSSSTYNDDNSSINLSNAIPGHLVAYEDKENDLLLVGDLNWKDFVRVAKRIRILPAKSKSRKEESK